MKPFMGENFLLSNDVAVTLFHEHAKDLPIIDYHCHLSPKEIYENKQFHNITEAWLYGDHYKWRAMRANGILEEYITGSASDYEKFLAWAKTVPMTIGNPLYNWTHLELQRFFGINEILNEKTAPMIWEKVNQLLSQEDFSVRALIKKSGVEVICTTDDPVDELEYHQMLRKEENFDTKVLPSFRPDKGLEINRDGFVTWVERLAIVSGNAINDYHDFLSSLESRIEFFHELGGRVSDHAIDVMMFTETTKEEVNQIFCKALSGEKITLDEEQKYKSFTLVFLGEKYASLGWAMQLHINALRNNNKRKLAELGPDTGFDCMNDDLIAKPLVQFLDSLEQKHSLPKTILYSLNPRDNHVLASIIGSFQGDGVPGKMQFGTAWWFNDQKDGMLDQMKALANIGLFSQFIGMLTDSRSFLSYTRHEYFRRLVCNLIGEWVENGEVPNDPDLLGSIVKGISYDNARNYFQFSKVTV
ncbi:glucuronate isomerase [Metabacillus niabensis]|uniref:Uronate isomerase n=2 Tax=Metabacillus niabensis TaxID=324854 RepID=A0ABT9Z6W6_9BACI|nr:glucuronate isomerase [Metabacillus niabensis]MDQ0228001.1 glucuronate isomerase [Metabacillus niabensis]